MSLIEEYNNKYFHDVMVNEELDTVCHGCFEEHKQNTNEDFWLVDNIAPPVLDVDKSILDPKKEFFARNNGGYDRKVIPFGDSRMLIQELDRQGEATNMVKKQFGCEELVLNLHIQEPGTMISYHVDYNRSLFRDYPEKSMTLQIKNMKRWVWFMQDQQIGQMFMVGRKCLHWKAGDVYQWPWYMPHATANASPHDRHILTLIGF